MLAGEGSELTAVSTHQIAPHVTKQVDILVKDGILLGMILSFLGKGRVFSEMHTGTVDEVLSLPVRDIMTAADIRTVSADMPINTVAKEMLSRGIGAFPVMDGGRLSGIVTEFDLVKALTGKI